MRTCPRCGTATNRRMCRKCYLHERYHANIEESRMSFARQRKRDQVRAHLKAGRDWQDIQVKCGVSRPTIASIAAVLRMEGQQDLARPTLCKERHPLGFGTDGNGRVVQWCDCGIRYVETIWPRSR